MRVAVVGATGEVGRMMLRVMAGRSFPATEVVAFASPRSEGSAVSYGDRELTVRALRKGTENGFDLALFSAGSQISRYWAQKFVRKGAVVIDNSSAWRRDRSVPLVVAEVNPEALKNHQGIVANPNCSTMQMLVVLGPIHRAVGLKSIRVVTFQAVSGTGHTGEEELWSQVYDRTITNIDRVIPKVYPHPIAFNVIPAGEFEPGDPYTSEERKLVDETGKILGDPAIRISPSCKRVPVMNGHSEDVTIRTHMQLSVSDCRELLRSTPGVVVVDDPSTNQYPTALQADGRDEVFVGLIRPDLGDPTSINMWIVADNLRKGAATNAVQIAQLVVERGLLR